MEAALETFGKDETKGLLESLGYEGLIEKMIAYALKENTEQENKNRASPVCVVIDSHKRASASERTLFQCVPASVYERRRGCL